MLKSVRVAPKTESDNVQIFTNRAAQGIAECERSLALAGC